MTIILRDAQANDESICMNLLAELQATTGSETSNSTASIFASLLDKSRGQVVLAEEDGVVLGMATVSYNIALRYRGEYCQLEELIVTPQARGKRLGALLVEKIIENAKARGCAEIGLYLLESTQHNQPFYEKFGFIALGAEMRQRLN